MINVNDKLIKEDLAKMKPNAFAVLMAITCHINRTNTAFPSLNRLKTLTGLGRDSVYAGVQKLIELGYLTRVQQNQNGEFGKTIYKVTTKYLSVWVGVDDVEMESNDKKLNQPFTEIADTVLPDTENKEQKQLTTIEVLINNEVVAANASKQTPIEKIEFDKAIRKKEFETSLVPFLGKYDKTMLRDFADYWTENNYGKKKMRFENEQFFDISRRLATWYKRSKEKIAPKDETPVYTMPKSIRSQATPIQILADAAQKMKA